MNQFTPKTFTIPALIGITEKTIEEHIKLYEGYVKNANLILEKIPVYQKDADADGYALAELQRRFAFEFNGMRNHEIYFNSLVGGPQELGDGKLKEKIEATWGSVSAFIDHFKSLALTRGIGWAMLFFDAKTDRLLTQWVDEQHLGHLTDCSLILGIDMWEHSFVADYQPSGKKQYVEDFFKNLNWSVIEQNFANARV